MVYIITRGTVSYINYEDIVSSIHLGGRYMPNSWGRPPRYDVWHDLQFLALWVFVIGVVGYLLFPGFFDNVYDRLTDQTVADTQIPDYTIPATSENGDIYPTLPPLDLPNIYNPYYQNNNEISTGYWAMFVTEGELKQMPLSTEGYSFLIKLVENDQKANEAQTLILTENGQIRKFEVSTEIYEIVRNLSLISARANL